MAIWTKNLKVRHIVIISISIFMVYTKYARLITIATAITLIDQFTSNHCFSYGCKRWLKSFLGRLINARFRTVFSIVTSMTYEFFKAMITGKFSFPLVPLRNIVTRGRAVFSFIASRRNMRKSIIANQAISCNFSSSVFRLATTRAIF